MFHTYAHGYTLHVYKEMPLWAQTRPLLYLNNLFDISNVCIIPVGGRLKDFKILIGQQFLYGKTQTEQIGLWKKCASFSGK